MKIAVIYDRFVRGGGLENYLSDFVGHLIFRGHEITVVTTRTDAETQAIGAEIVRLRPGGLTPAGRIADFDHQARIAVEKIGAEVSIGFGRTTSHDLHRAGGGCHKVYNELLSPIKRLSSKNRRELQLERELYTSGRTKHFVVNSTMVANQLRNIYNLESSRVSVIHTAVDTERFCPDLYEGRTLKRDICAELRIDPEVPVYLFVSLGHRRKGLDAIMEAWPEIDGHVWIVGNPLDKTYLKALRKMGLERKVFHLGRKPDPTPYYRAADFFLHPTLYDACANTVLQSMACGVPGLISKHDGACQFVDDSTGFILENPWDPQCIIDTVIRANAVSAEDRLKMAQAATRAVSHLSWDYHLGSWMTVIDQKLG